MKYYCRHMNSIINGWNSTKPVETAYFHCGPCVNYDCPGSILVQVLCRVSVEIHSVHLLLWLDGGVGISEFWVFWRSSKYFWFHRGELFFSWSSVHSLSISPFWNARFKKVEKFSILKSFSIFTFSDSR